MRGPFGEREFRLLFLGQTTSFVGSAFANVALAFAVLDLTGSKADVGYVLAARALPQLVFVLVGGIWSDRLPRHHVMVASNIVSGIAQAAVATLLFTGNARLWQLVALAAVGGTSAAFFYPASAGVVPQTVPAALLQRANAVLRLGLNASWIGGSALGGIVVAATSPAAGIACDAASFIIAAVFIGLMHLPATLRLEGSHFLGELADGWHEFRSRAWLWAIVLQFGFVNAVEQGSINVLGPAVAKESLGGPAAWGLIVTGLGAGLLVGGMVLLRARPRRILLVATVGVLLSIPLPLGLAVPLPLAVLVAIALVAGIGIETFGILWDTALQQEIPQDRLSRVASYDSLGSIALVPLGLAVAGPLAEAIGTDAALVGAALTSLVATLAVLLVPDVRRLERQTRPTRTA